MREQVERPLAQNHSERLDSMPLIATKLYAPPARANTVARPHLVEKLLLGTSQPDRFVLVSAPAGFGKTTLLGEFTTMVGQSVAWISLDEGDNDAFCFWTYLITACNAILSDVGESALELLSARQPLPDDTIPTLLINDLAAHEQSIVLILDDYHAVQNTSIHASVQFLLEHLPRNLHLIISTRIDPPFPLARFRARNQLIEIRARDLRFSSDEAATFLNRTMGLQLSAEEVAALGARTEGWIVGLQLAALSLQGRSDAAEFIQAFTGSHVYVAEYLFEEVFLRQPDAVQIFLLRTSMLHRLNAGLCEAVTDCADGQAILTDLHRANIFIVPLDSAGQWFRYHHLFADLLGARLQQQHSTQEIAALHQRASDWYAQHGFVPEAVDHALAGRDFERAAILIDHAGKTMLFTDQSSLDNWLDTLPDESFHAHPRLQIYRGLISLSQATLDMSEATLLEQERFVRELPPSPENDRLRLETMMYLCLFLAHQNTSRTIQIAQETLAETPASDHRLRTMLFSALYRAHGMDGDIEQAAAAYRECVRLALAGGLYGVAANTTMVRAFDLCQYGRLEEAADYCHLIVERGEQSEQRVFYAAGPAYIGLAGIHLEWNDLDEAEDYLTRGIELCRQGGLDGLYAGYTTLARLHQARGDLEQAWKVLSDLEQVLQRRDFFLLTRQVSVQLALGNVASLAIWVAPIEAALGGTSDSPHLPLVAVEALNLLLARILIARGELDRASHLLDAVQVTAEPDKRYGRLLEVHLLRALLVQQAAGQVTAEAVDCLQRALELGESAGFVLLFLEEGQTLVPLLNAVLNRRSAPDQSKQYARKLLSVFTGARDIHPSGEAPGLVESLTPREVEVLQRIAVGDSNQAIADRLFITVRTVKKHMTNILGKLDASNRTQAVARARELGLISSD